MPEQRSVYTQVSVELGQALAEMRKQADKSKAVPFGMERVSAEAEAKAMITMKPEELKAKGYLDPKRLGRTLDLARKGLKRA